MPSPKTLAPRFAATALAHRLLGEDGRRLRSEGGSALGVEQAVGPARMTSELAQRLTTEALTPLVTEQLYHG